MATTAHRILCVCTSASTTSYGATAGIWLEELAAPYYIWKDAGYTVEVCTIAGGAPPIDPLSVQGGDALDELSVRFQQDSDAHYALHAAPALSEVITQGRLGSYACVYLLGGHACLEDFPDSEDVKEAVEHFYADVGGCLAAISHGPIGLHRCMYKGEKLLKGKFVAGFSNEEETMLELNTSIKLSVEDALDATGAVCAPRAPFRPNAVVDGRVVTGQNPQTSVELAQRVLDVLRTLGDKFNAPNNVNKPWGK
jgi:putative intracellular protease/amidase